MEVCFVWLEVDVRHKCRTLKGECLGGRCISSRAAGKGEGVTQSVPPNLRA